MSALLPNKVSYINAWKKTKISGYTKLPYVCSVSKESKVYKCLENLRYQATLQKGSTEARKLGEKNKRQT